MTAIFTGLGDLIAPNDPDRLRQAIVDKVRLHMPTEKSAEFGDLLPWGVFNELLTIDRLISGQARVIRDNRDIPLEMYTASDMKNRRRVIMPDRLYALCKSGVSVIINNLQFYNKQIAAVLSMIERNLSSAGNVNLYASFGRSSAFQPHADDHDVLILQLHGRKHWKCFGHRDANSAAETPTRGANEPGEAEWEAVLEPGDALYVPRGDVHAGSVIEPHSLHLTISINYPTGADLVDWAMTQAEGSAEFDRYIIGLGGRNALEEQAEAIKAALRDVSDKVDLDAFGSTYDPGLHYFEPISVGLVDKIEPETWIVPALRKRVSLPLDKGFTLEVKGEKLTLSADERLVLDRLLERDAIQFSSLGSADLVLSPEALHDAVCGLAFKSLVFLFD